MSFYGGQGSTFAAAPLAGVTLNVTQAQIVSIQTASGSPVTAMTIPLPGTVGAPIESGMIELQVVVRAYDINLPDNAAALFKMSWGWFVASSGSPIAIGSLVSILSAGSVGGNPPSGWAATVALDGGSLNALVLVNSADDATINVSVQAEWNYLQ